MEINNGDVSKHTAKVTAIFSDDDSFVPMENVEFFRSRLNAEIIVENKMGHFTESDGVKEILFVLRLIK